MPDALFSYCIGFRYTIISEAVINVKRNGLFVTILLHNNQRKKDAAAAVDVALKSTHF
jgi:hypothetical protein